MNSVLACALVLLMVTTPGLSAETAAKKINKMDPCYAGCGPPSSGCPFTCPPPPPPSPPSPVSCAGYADCADCNNAPGGHCGFCAEGAQGRGICMRGNSQGPDNGSCRSDNWKWYESQCPSTGQATLKK